MRSYGQYCAVARALDVIGERWTLLIIRELMADDRRYADLKDNLPGIATNLLSDRLRSLVEHGLVESYRAPAPIRARMYRLTARGIALRPMMREVFRWGAALATERENEDEFRIDWMCVGVPTIYHGADLADIAVTVRIEADGQVATLVATDGAVTMQPGEPSHTPDVSVMGPADAIFRLLTGALPDDSLQITGSTRARAQFRRLTRRSTVTALQPDTPGG